MENVWSVCVGYKEEQLDPVSRRVRWEIRDLGVKGVEWVKTVQVFQLKGKLDKSDIKFLCEELLHDPIVQEYTYVRGEKVAPLFEKPGVWVVEVRYKPGVFDSLAGSVLEGAKVIGVQGLEEAETYTIYLLSGDLNHKKVELICRRCLANPIIHSYKIYTPPDTST